MITKTKAKKLKNGQHIKVNYEGKWIDALVIQSHDFEWCTRVYVQFMEHKKGSSKFGTTGFFDLKDIEIPTIQEGSQV